MFPFILQFLIHRSINFIQGKHAGQRQGLSLKQQRGLSHLFLELYDNMARSTKYCRIKEEDFGLEKGGIFIV